MTAAQIHGSPTEAGTEADPESQVRPRFVHGVFAVAVLLAFSRWGSKFGLPPIYISDILVLSAIGYVVTRNLMHKGESGPRLRTSPWIYIFLGYVVFRVCLSFTPTMPTIRDMVPYTLYVTTALIGLSTLNNSRRRSMTYSLLFIALAVHVAWLLPVVATGHFAGWYIGGRFFFEVRHDIDFPIAGMFAALLLVRIAMEPKHRGFCGIALALCMVALSVQGNRGGFMGSMAVIAVAIFVILCSPKAWPEMRTALVTGLLVLGIFIVPLLQLSDAGKRILTSLSDDGSSGSANARSQAWELLIAWVQKNPRYDMFGSGFTVNILEESGADVKLLGRAIESVRAPHNFWVNTYAQLGIVGLLLFGIIVALFLWSLYSNRQKLAESPLYFLAHVIPVGILVPASVGVILEAPFGAIPFWWSIGIVLGSSGGLFGVAKVAGGESWLLTWPFRAKGDPDDPRCASDSASLPSVTARRAHLYDEAGPRL